MSDKKMVAIAGDAEPKDLGFVPKEALATAVWLDNSVVEDCMFSHATWIKADCERPGLIRYDSDVLFMCLSCDPADKEKLHADLEFWIENDKLSLTDTCYIFVPKGAAFGNIKVTNLTRPFLFYELHMTESDYKPIPVEAATAPVGTYAGNHVEKYAPVDGHLPEGPEGFLQLMLWIDGEKLKGAPYMEGLFFCTANPTGPSGHAHDFDEVIGFVGTDYNNPADLGARVQFVLDDRILEVTKSALFYIPRGTMHSPIVVPDMDRPIYHWSGGNGGDYARKQG